MNKPRKTKIKTRRLPPLNALRAFEAAGRLESLTDAAEELSVTPAAVGHQVKALESYFEQTLFERRYRSIALTEKGRLLLAGLTDGFDQLADTVDAFNALEDQRNPVIFEIPAVQGSDNPAEQGYQAMLCPLHDKNGNLEGVVAQLGRVSPGFEVVVRLCGLCQYFGVCSLLYDGTALLGCRLGLTGRAAARCRRTQPQPVVHGRAVAELHIRR